MSEVRRTWYSTSWPLIGKRPDQAKNGNLLCLMQLFEALLYGLETLHLTQSLAKKLDAFQMRGLRKILGRPTTFYDRTCTNQRVLEEATSIVYTAPGDQCKIQLFSEFHNNRRAKLMGDILRTNADDPLRQVSFLPDSAHRLDYGKKRVGKPRQN